MLRPRHASYYRPDHAYHLRRKATYCLVFTFLLISSHMGKLRLRMSCKLKSSAYSFEIRSPRPLAPIFVRMSSTHKGTVVMAQKSHGTGFGFPHSPCASPAILVLGGEFPSQGGVQAATMVQGWGKFHPKPAPGTLQSRLIWKPRLFPASRLPSHRAKPRCPHT